MRNVLTLLIVVGILTGCASATPTCDGKDRRPINIPAQARMDYPSCGASA